MASMDEPASPTASSATHQIQAEARTTSSMPDTIHSSLEHIQDIFTIICCNDSFQFALDLNTIKTLLRVCRRVRPLLSYKLTHFQSWCQKAGLCRPDGSLRFGLTPSDQIALSLHFECQGTADRSWLKDQAIRGNAAASYFMAWKLSIELRGQQSLDPSECVAQQQQIFHLMETAAKAKHSMAQFQLALCYRDAFGVKRDQPMAIELYRELAELGMPQAQVALGLYYEYGESVDQDFDTAIEWYSKAAAQGYDFGRLRIGFLRGWFSLIGHGVKQSDVAAFNHWQEVSTKSTDPFLKPIATHMLGWMHYLGRGTVRDDQKGVKIIRENQSEIFKLGEAEGLASQWNNIKSEIPAHREFFELCKLGSNRDWLCRHLMAVCLFYGFGTTQNRTKAAGILEQLANNGHSESQFWFGVCYYSGGGVSEDEPKGFEWFSKSASQGNSYGQWMVGYCYLLGAGVPQDGIKAFEWYRKSAEQGNRYGQYSLGECYKNGWGVPQNIDTAVDWYRKSADQDLDWSVDCLRELAKWP